MKKAFSIILIVTGIHLFALLVFSQNPVPTPRPRPRPFKSGTGEGAENNQRTVQAVHEGSADDQQAVPNLRPLSSIRHDIRDRLKLSDDEKENYRKLVGDRRANPVRVIKAFSCSTSMVIDLSDPRCQDNPDLALVSYYSFRFKDYGESPWTDLSFIEDDMTAGNKWQTAGFIADLGDAEDFAKLDTDSEEVKTLWEFQEARNVGDRAKQKAELEKGFMAGKLSLTSKLKFQANHTYLVRTISYRVDGAFMALGYGFSWHNTDSIFAFKVMELNDDRVITLVWKKLAQRVSRAGGQERKE